MSNTTPVSASENTYRCSRGFLIERQNDGVFTPFFVKVRAIDVLDNDGYPLFPNGNIDIEGMISISEKDNWTIIDYGRRYYEATTTIDVRGGVFTKTAGNDTEIYSIVMLPRPTMEEGLNVTLTVNSDSNTVMTSFVSFRPYILSGQSIDGILSAIKVSLRNLAYTFSNDWDTLSDIAASKICIRISGIYSDHNIVIDNPSM